MIVAADFVIQFTSVTAAWPVTVVRGVLAASFGFIGYRLLAMTPAAWLAAASSYPRPGGGVPNPKKSAGAAR